MAYPTIPLKGYWNNQTQYLPKLDILGVDSGGIIQRSRSNFINPVRRSRSVSGVITNYETLDTFLRTRNGLPFEYRPDADSNLDGEYTCIEWSFQWKVYIPPKGVWVFTGTFIENFNPEIT